MTTPVAISPDDRRVHAAKLGMWVFLGSELLLFAGLFAVYAGYRVREPVMFAHGAAATDLVLGTLNTALLLTSSFVLVLGVHARRVGRPRLAGLLVGTTVAFGAAFLVVKAVEYADHLAHGLRPDGSPVFWTLYYAMTGLHALHVFGGMVALTVLAWCLLFRRVEPHVLENGANWWHLVDLVWLFLWPLFYLLRKG
jgi:cytochrome c oxidase subunit 3